MEQNLKKTVGPGFKFFVAEKPHCYHVYGLDPFKNELLRLIEENHLPIKLINIYVGVLPMDTVKEHYKNKKDAPYFGELCGFMTSGPCALFEFETTCEIEVDILFGILRTKVFGPTDPAKAPKGTLRGDLGTDKMRNAGHCPEDRESAEHEHDNFETALPYLEKVAA